MRRPFLIRRSPKPKTKTEISHENKGLEGIERGSARPSAILRNKDAGSEAIEHPMKYLIEKPEAAAI
jgi:hypothetical protein